MKTFNEEQLTSFGNYLLSKQRTKSFKKASENDVPKSERLKHVNHSDYENWLAATKK